MGLSKRTFIIYNTKLIREIEIKYKAFKLKNYIILLFWNNN